MQENNTRGVKMKPKTDLDYVELYAEKLRNDKKIFKQQKKLIDSQIIASQELFFNAFGAKNFKENARKYLKEIGIIKSHSS